MLAAFPVSRTASGIGRPDRPPFKPHRADRWGRMDPSREVLILARIPRTIDGARAPYVTPQPVHLLASLAGVAVLTLAWVAVFASASRTDRYAVASAPPETAVEPAAERAVAAPAIPMAEPEAARKALARFLIGVKGRGRVRGAGTHGGVRPGPRGPPPSDHVAGGQAAGRVPRRPVERPRVPWVAASEHAAEALVALRRVETAQALVAACHGPDPRAPYTRDTRGGGVYFTRGVVRVNHRQNCLMCHPASFSDADPLRRAVPPCVIQGSATASASRGAGSRLSCARTSPISDKTTP